MNSRLIDENESLYKEIQVMQARIDEMKKELDVMRALYKKNNPNNEKSSYSDNPKGNSITNGDDKTHIDPNHIDRSK